MRIGVIQASSQKDKNSIVYQAVVNAVAKQGHEVVNFGIFEGEEAEYSYVETAMMISMLLESKAVDFVVTGCSSGQGMMLACNSLPGILCGYVETPTDAYLFGRINDGNAVSIPLGLQFGWAAEINLQCVMERLFDEPFGMGYPKQDAERKQKDTKLLKELNAMTKRSLKDLIPNIEPSFMKKVLQRETVVEYIKENGKDQELWELIKKEGEKSV